MVIHWTEQSLPKRSGIGALSNQEAVLLQIN